MKYLLLGFFLLTSCAPVKNSPQLKVETLRPQLLQLPGAVVSDNDPLSFSYPDQVMYGTHAVLPMPGGPKLLNPLAQFLNQNPQQLWQVDIRVQTIYGEEYDQLLAEKRSELLASYLQNKGVDLKNLYFQPSSTNGEQLVFSLKPSTAILTN